MSRYFWNRCCALKVRSQSSLWWMLYSCPCRFMLYIWQVIFVCLLIVLNVSMQHIKGRSATLFTVQVVLSHVDLRSFAELGGIRSQGHHPEFLCTQSWCSIFFVFFFFPSWRLGITASSCSMILFVQQLKTSTSCWLSQRKCFIWHVPSHTLFQIPPPLRWRLGVAVGWNYFCSPC